MKKTLIKKAKCAIALVVFGTFLTGCSTESADFLNNETHESVTASKVTSAKKSADTKFNFTTNLSGSHEVPANDSKATGQAIVTISKDETKIHYKLIAANIENITASHFHVAPAGTNGGAVAFLYKNQNPQPSGVANGVLAEGYITADHLFGAFEGDLSALIAAIRDGNIYINVHTTSIPSGEIRGQL